MTSNNIQNIGKINTTHTANNLVFGWVIPFLTHSQFPFLILQETK